MARIENWETVIDGSGRPVGGASVDIWLARTVTPATVFAAETGGTTLANPVTTVNGAIPGWLEEGEYDLRVSGVGITTTTRRFNAIRGGQPALAANQVTAAELNADSVGASEIQAGAVGNSELAGDAVDSTKLAADSVGSSEIQANAVDSSELATDSVGSSEIAPSAVGNAEIAADAVGSSEIAAGAVGSSEMADNAVGEEEITTALAEKLGVSETSIVRRGKSIIAAEEARTNVAYGTLTTPDQVQNVVLPTDGLIAVLFDGMVKSSVASAGRLAIFLGANQLRADTSGAADPAIVEVATSGTGYAHYASGARGLDRGVINSYAGALTTGQVIGIDEASSGNRIGSPAYIFAAAGTYTVSVQFKATSGSVTAKERKLWVWTVGF